MRIRCSSVDNISDTPDIIGDDNYTRSTWGQWGNCSNNKDPTDQTYLVKSEAKSNKQDIYNTSNPDYLTCSIYMNNITGEFNCSGHRQFNASPSLSSISDVSSGTIISANQYNSVKNQVAGSNYTEESISSEVLAREAHTFYKDKLTSYIDTHGNIDDVNNTNMISSSNQQKLFKIMAKMKELVYENNDYKDDNAIEISAPVIAKGFLVETSSLNLINSDARYLYNDCICFSDCYDFSTKLVKYCVCNINCKCNYG